MKLKRSFELVKCHKKIIMEGNCDSAKKTGSEKFYHVRVEVYEKAGILLAIVVGTIVLLPL